MATRIIRNDDFYYVESDILYVIADSINSILKTSPGERVGEPAYGCNMRSYLFDLENVLLEDIETDLVNAILTYEPRVEIEDITLTSDKEKYTLNIKLILKIIETNEALALTAEVSN